MASTNNSLGYVVVEGAEGQFRGASLVVDARGIPMDFRYTAPIRSMSRRKSTPTLIFSAS